MAILILDHQTSLKNSSSTDIHVSECPTYEPDMKATNSCLEDEDSSDIDHEDFIKRIYHKTRVQVLVPNFGMPWRISSSKRFKVSEARLIRGASSDEREASAFSHEKDASRGGENKWRSNGSQLNIFESIRK